MEGYGVRGGRALMWRDSGGMWRADVKRAAAKASGDDSALDKLDTNEQFERMEVEKVVSKVRCIPLPSPQPLTSHGNKTMASMSTDFCRCPNKSDVISLVWWCGKGPGRAGVLPGAEDHAGHQGTELQHPQAPAQE